MAEPREDYGVVAKTMEEGKPVILSISKGANTDANRAKFPWLVVIAWKYDGGAMPAKDINEKMLRLEDAIEDDIVTGEHCIHAVSRTGNGLKEWEYYIKDQADFTTRFNKAVMGHERYPIKITFYSDPEWKELTRFVGMLKKKEPINTVEPTSAHDGAPGSP